jgi:hypothetical protein
VSDMQAHHPISSFRVQQVHSNKRSKHHCTFIW